MLNLNFKSCDLIKKTGTSGMGLVEVIIAVFLTTVGILALLTLQPTARSTTLHADYVGRAAGILHKTMEDNENWIINPCNSVTLGDQDGEGITVYTSGENARLRGDIGYMVKTNIVQDGGNVHGFVVTVTVTWRGTAGQNARSISESVTVARQEFARFPTGCPNGVVN
jgi:hypothetical protein